MNYGSPKIREVLVEMGGKEEQKLRAAHRVLWTSNARDGKWTVTVCDEVPSKETCGSCLWRDGYGCKYSLSSERK